MFITITIIIVNYYYNCKLQMLPLSNREQVIDMEVKVKTK